MEPLTKWLIILIASLHGYFLWMEMFGWTTIAPKVFKNFSPSFFNDSKTLAANQGLYNGFLAAGLIWSLAISDPEWEYNVSLFFLICVAIAGIYGTITVARKIFFIQALPAIVTIALLVFYMRS